MVSGIPGGFRRRRSVHGRGSRGRCGHRAGTVSGNLQGDRNLINAEFVHVFRFKGGRVSDWQSYTDTAQFKEAVGGYAVRVSG